MENEKPPGVFDPKKDNLFAKTSETRPELVESYKKFFFILAIAILIIVLFWDDILIGYIFPAP